MDQADSKVGAYPNADQPNQFGTFYRDFITNWRQFKVKPACYPDYIGALGILKANKDAEFERFIQNLDLLNLELNGTDEKPGMVQVMWEGWALTVRLNWWNWKQAPEIPIEITR